MARHLIFMVTCVLAALACQTTTPTRSVGDGAVSSLSVDASSTPVPSDATAHDSATTDVATPDDVPDAGEATAPQADVVQVSASGEGRSYRLSVTLESPDTGCEQYADWWEVITLEGDLVYRRILAHSHVDEQPFTRSGGPVSVAADQAVIVRAHMSNGGYGGQVMRGSVAEGFSADMLEASFAEGVAERAPRPDGCAF